MQYKLSSHKLHLWLKQLSFTGTCQGLFAGRHIAWELDERFPESWLASNHRSRAPHAQHWMPKRVPLETGSSSSTS